MIQTRCPYPKALARLFRVGESHEGPSFAPLALDPCWVISHGLRSGLYSFAASRLRRDIKFVAAESTIEFVSPHFCSLHLERDSCDRVRFGGGRCASGAGYEAGWGRWRLMAQRRPRGCDWAYAGQSLVY